jgi:hypothetical protein
MIYVEGDLDLKTVTLSGLGKVQGVSSGVVQPQWNATAVTPGIGQAPATLNGSDVTFAFDNVLPGTYDAYIMMKLDDGTYRMSGRQQFGVTTGQTTVVNFEPVIQFAAPRPTYPLGGMLRSSGYQISDLMATVSIEGTMLSTKSMVGDSYSWMDGVPPGRLTVDFSAPNYGPVSVLVFVGGASENPSIPIVTFAPM